ncbi:hypothetical protein H5410_053216 [Solanum commersonii]|uniref:Uncharacterized protein n=1 Tax=Solanum commersonii TaxID=4109 RepID=A0A9J5X5C8_SOLCO|nr:hypothetical protein H5410_053216 [Solanum commersonii]
MTRLSRNGVRLSCIFGDIGVDVGYNVRSDRSFHDGGERDGGGTAVSSHVIFECLNCGGGDGGSCSHFGRGAARVYE